MRMENWFNISYEANTHAVIGLTYHIEDIIETRDPLHFAVADTCDTEDGRRVDGYTSDTDPLLHELKPDDELDTTIGVKLAEANAEEHSEVRLGLGGLPYKLSNVADILEFSFGLASIRTSLATETTENVTSCFLATHLGEPTWGLGKESNDAQSH